MLTKMLNLLTPAKTQTHLRLTQTHQHKHRHGLSAVQRLVIHKASEQCTDSNTLHLMHFLRQILQHCSHNWATPQMNSSSSPLSFNKKHPLPIGFVSQSIYTIKTAPQARKIIPYISMKIKITDENTFSF